MRTTEALPGLGLDALATVTGGCKKKMPPPPPQAAMAPPDDSGVDVTVATGEQAAQLIGGAGPGAAPQAPRMI